MCSQSRAEIEAVKDELTKAGIATETRNNPMAEALGVNGLELWVQDERDFFNAANLFARMQAPAFLSSAEPDRAVLPLAHSDPLPVTDPTHSPSGAEAPDPERARSSLEKQLDELLQSESQLASRCASLRNSMKQWGQAIAERQAGLAREIENRTAVERKQAEELSELRSALKHGEAESLKLNQQRERERDEWHQQSKAREETLHKIQEKFLSQSRLLQTHEASVLKLRAEILELQRQREEDARSAAKLREELDLERKARFAAEQVSAEAEKRIENAVLAQRSLETQLREQKQLEQDFRAHVAHLSSLFDKLGPRTTPAASPEWRQ
jgi:hypothetical protein